MAVYQIQNISLKKLYNIPFITLRCLSYDFEATESDGYMKRIRKSLIFLLHVLTVYICMTFELTFVIDEFKNDGDFLESTYTLACVFVANMAALKLVTLFWKNVEVLAVIKQLDELYSENLSLKDEQEIRDRATRAITKIVMFYFFLNTILITVFNTASIFHMLLNVIIYGRTDLYLLYSAKYPLDPSNPFNYVIIVLHEFWAGVNVFVGLTTTDSLFFIFLNQVCMHYELLKYNIQHLFDDMEDLNEEDMAPHFEKSHIMFHSFVKRHNCLIEISKKINDIFSLAILVNLMSSCMLLCVVGFNITAMDLNGSIMFTIFLTSMFLQVYALCFMSNELMVWSSSICDGIYNSQWHNADLKMKRSLLIMMLRSQKPEVINASKFNVISLNSFTQLLNTSMSYFTLLRTLYEPDA